MKLKKQIKEPKTKWAGLFLHQNLNCNWRIIKTPEEIVEYVVVHELIHLEGRTTRNASGQS